jgi:hypothetical protein
MWPRWSSSKTIKLGPGQHRNQLRWLWCNKRGKVTLYDEAKRNLVEFLKGLSIK